MRHSVYSRRIFLLRKRTRATAWLMSNESLSVTLGFLALLLPDVPDMKDKNPSLACVQFAELQVFLILILW